MNGTTYLLAGNPAGRAGSVHEPAPSLLREGPVIVRADGSIDPLLWGSEFPLLRMWLDHDARVSRLLADRYAVGQRGVIVFATNENAPYELPGPYSDYEVADGIATLADYVRRQGFHLHLNVFQGTGHGVMPGWQRQVAWWNTCLDLGATRAAISIGFSQEWWKQILPWSQLRQPTQHQKPFLLWEGGATADGIAYGPLTGHHRMLQTQRSADWPRKSKSGFDVTELYRDGRGTYVQEGMGAWEFDSPGRRSNNPDDFAWSAANSRMCQGSAFHSQDGATGNLFGPVQRAIALGHFRTLNTIPARVQLGRYAKAVPGGQATATVDELRTYGMMVSDAEQWVFITRPGPSYPRNGRLVDPGMLNGWRVADRFEPFGTILRCVR